MSEFGAFRGTGRPDAGALQHIEVGGLTVAYRQMGTGRPVLFLHGWPASSYLWRQIMPAVAAAGRLAIAPDLPGFGHSDKPAEATYTLDFHARLLQGFLATLGVDRTALVAHDLGGPVGLLWAVRHPEQVEWLVLLDTLVFPRRLLLLCAMLALLRGPGVGGLSVRPAGLRLLLRLGVWRRSGPDEPTRTAYLRPFTSAHERQVLLRTLLAPRLDEFDEIHAGLRRLASLPTLIAWADRDLLLPRSEMRRLVRALPAAQSQTVEHAGHFLQEDQPEQIAQLIAGFLRPDDSRRLAHSALAWRPHCEGKKHRMTLYRARSCTGVREGRRGEGLEPRGHRVESCPCRKVSGRST